MPALITLLVVRGGKSLQPRRVRRERSQQIPDFSRLPFGVKTIVEPNFERTLVDITSRPCAQSCVARSLAENGRAAEVNIAFISSTCPASSAFLLEKAVAY